MVHAQPIKTAICMVMHDVAGHMMDKRKSFVFPGQYRNCFSRRFSALLPRN